MFYLSTFASSCDFPSLLETLFLLPPFLHFHQVIIYYFLELFTIFCFPRFFHYRESSLLVTITDLQYLGRILSLIDTLLFILINPHKKLAPISFDPKKFPFLFKTTQL